MEHLFFTKVEKPSQDRRKRGGFPPSSDRKNNIQHREGLLSQVRNHVSPTIKAGLFISITQGTISGLS